MNPRSVEIISKILQSENAWDKKTRELKFNYVLDEFSKARETIWMDTVYFPFFNRAIRRIETWELYPPDHFEDIEINPGEFVRSISCIDCLTEVMNRLDFYLERLWFSPEWAGELITKQDILDLNIRPHVVPPKPQQPSLF